jgi:hypothetical protein
VAQHVGCSRYAIFGHEDVRVQFDLPRKAEDDSIGKSDYSARTVLTMRL